MALPYLNKTGGPFRFEMVRAPTQITFTADAQGRLLHFRGARLARAEVNKNSDEITPAGIGELAATIAGNAMDVEHQDRVICGIFTEGVAVKDPELGDVLEVGGLVHADRYPEVAAGMQDGTYQLSIEADGKQASCSVCGGIFASSDLYCEHLRNKLKTGAVRRVEGLTALGGGVVRNPAGNGTDFRRATIKFVASQADPDLSAGWLEDELPEGQTRSDLEDSDFADPAGRRFPYKIHGKISKRGWLAAWSAAHGSHTGESDKAAIAKLKRDKPAGVEVQESEQPDPMEAPMKKCPYCSAELTTAVDACPACHKSLMAAAMAPDLAEALARLNNLEIQKKDAETSLATAQASAATLTAAQTDLAGKLEKAQADLTAAQAKLDAELELRRRLQIGARMTDAVWAEKKADVLSMSEAAFQTMLSLAPAQSTQTMLGGMRDDGAGAPASEGKKTIKIVL